MGLSVLTWLLWGLVSFFQNAAFTWVSRARNGGDPTWLRFASWGSNGIWAVNIALGGDKLIQFWRGHQYGLFVFALVFYALITTEGSVWAQKRLIKVESGKRAVGGR